MQIGKIYLQYEIEFSWYKPDNEERLDRRHDADHRIRIWVWEESLIGKSLPPPLHQFLVVLELLAMLLTIANPFIYMIL